MSESEKRSAFPELELELEVKDKNGKLIQKHRQKARSWTKNFILMLRYAFASSDLNAIEQNGSLSYITGDKSYTSVFGVTAGNGDASYGILVGSGTNPYSINDYTLQNKITPPVLNYGSTTVEDLTDTGTTLYFGIARTFFNNSTNPVTVTEVGLAPYTFGTKVLIARDLLSTPVTVPQGGTLTIRYVITYKYA